jgi:preprotein translocase subunit SecA
VFEGYKYEDISFLIGNMKFNNYTNYVKTNINKLFTIWNLCLNYSISLLKQWINIKLYIIKLEEVFIKNRKNFYSICLMTYLNIEKKNKPIFDNYRERIIKIGGLRIIGTEKNELRRVDNQLIGRSGRQGDPGCSCFYISLEDNIIKHFGGQKIKNLIEKMGLINHIEISHVWLSKSFDRMQKKIEQLYYEYRNYILVYDNTLDLQRNIFYIVRQTILFCHLFKDTIVSILEKIIAGIYTQQEMCSEIKLNIEKFVVQCKKYFFEDLKCYHIQEYNFYIRSIVVQFFFAYDQMI